MHIFLTGALQIGKSTIISRVISSAGLRVGGFRTSFGPDRASPDRLLYLYPAGAPPALDEAHGVVHFTGRVPTPIPGRFEQLGVPLLREARASASLIIMDECGRLESDALPFQAEILAALDGDIPVLGVVREGLPGWTPAVAAHPRVRLVTVTKENRDSLPAQLNRWVYHPHLDEIG